MNILAIRRRLLRLCSGNLRDLSQGCTLRCNEDQNIRNVYAHTLTREPAACL